MHMPTPVLHPYIPSTDRDANRRGILDVTLSQTQVEENSLLHVIGVHHLQLLSHYGKKGKYDNTKEDRSSKPTTLGRVNSSNPHSERGHTIKLGTGKTDANNTWERQ